MFNYLARYIFHVLRIGPIPNHIAFIMDGNRRFAKKKGMEERDGYRAGFLALMFMLKQCYELGTKYITIYSFSIDNFRRRPEDVRSLMELMQEKVEGFLEYESMISKYGIRVHFVGNLALLTDSLRAAAERAMAATAMNSTTFLLICVAYTSTDEIVHAVEKSCDRLEEYEAGVQILSERAIGEILTQDVDERKHGLELSFPVIRIGDVVRHLYMSLAPEPDVLIRTAGETRLSNFLLWQTPSCLLYCPKVLWPEIGLRHLAWAVLKFQRHYYYLQNIKEAVANL